jgi:hypothetical protein
VLRIRIPESAIRPQTDQRVEPERLIEEQQGRNDPDEAERCGCDHHRHRGDRADLKDDRNQLEGDHDGEQRGHCAIGLAGLLDGAAFLDPVACRQLGDDGLKRLPEGGGHVRRLQAVRDVSAHGDRRCAIAAPQDRLFHADLHRSDL